MAAASVGQPIVSEVYLINENSTLTPTVSISEFKEVDNSSRKSLVTTQLDGTATVVVVSKVALWKDWRTFGLGVAMLLFCSAAAVADQQISKSVNSDTFNAPFFYLWVAGFTRSFTFLLYLPIRLAYEAFAGHRRTKNVTKQGDSLPGQPSGRLTAKDVFREATAIFGPDGLTVVNCLKYVLPFSITWISTNGLFYWAVTFADVSECVTIGSSFIVMVYIISWIFLRERFLIFKLFGIIVCIAGIATSAYAAGTTIGSSADSLIGALLTTGSSASLAVTTVAFKKYLGAPNVNQIALYLSLTSLVNIVISWPIFLALKLTGNETWDFETARWDLMSAATIVSAVGAMTYYLAISLISPVFVSLTRPLQIVVNNAIDVSLRGMAFGWLNATGAGLVIIGFLMLIIPNNFVDFKIQRLVIKLRPGRTFIVNVENDPDANIHAHHQPIVHLKI